MHFEYIVIKPIGTAASMGSFMQESNTGNLNKGHIINAGVLYILESGLMKVLSTTGAVLVEKNINFDIDPSGNGEDEIDSIFSNPNPEEMFILILTKHGKLLKYHINLERQVDAESLLRNSNQTLANLTSNGTSLESTNLSREEAKKLRAAQYQNIVYDYVLSDSQF